MVDDNDEEACPKCDEDKGSNDDCTMCIMYRDVESIRESYRNMGDLP